MISLWHIRTLGSSLIYCCSIAKNTTNHTPQSKQAITHKIHGKWNPKICVTAFLCFIEFCCHWLPDTPNDTANFMIYCHYVTIFTVCVSCVGYNSHSHTDTHVYIYIYLSVCVWMWIYIRCRQIENGKLIKWKNCKNANVEQICNITATTATTTTTKTENR